MVRYGIERLSDEDVAFFKTYGYLVKESVLDPEMVAAARSLWWSKCPSPYVTADDPASWIGGFDGPDAEELQRTGTESNRAKGLHWGCREVGGSETFLDMLPRACWGAAEQLCGERTLVYPDGETQSEWNFAHPGANAQGIGSPGQACRGVYANFPPCLTEEERDEMRSRPAGGGHVDGWDGDRWRVSVNTTLDDVPPGGGAFTVWPGSHIRISPFRKQDFVPCEAGEEQSASDKRNAPPGMKRVRNPAFDEELGRIVADTEPVECHAPAGSVIFWHSRLVHSAGRNSGTGIRSGVIYEYYKKEDPTLDNSVIAEVQRGNLPDMWSDWSAQVQNCHLLDDGVASSIAKL